MLVLTSDRGEHVKQKLGGVEGFDTVCHGSITLTTVVVLPYLDPFSYRRKGSLSWVDGKLLAVVCYS